MENQRGKRIWLINQYAMPPKLESRLRTIKFAHYLQEAGYDVTIFASSIMHNMNIDLIADNSLFIERQYDDLNFVHIKTKMYKKNNLSRVIGLVQFPLRFLKIAKKYPAPDIIIQTATVPFGNIIYRYAKKVRAKYIVEVLDLWPETFADLEIISRKNPLLFFLYKAEKWLYTKADEIVFSMEGGKEYIIDKKWNIEQGGTINLSKVHYINNGVDLSDFDRYKNAFQLEDAELSDRTKRKVIYLGSIRLANT
ncbi:MAG: glycosyltransferase [Odoribacter sp.]